MQEAERRKTEGSGIKQFLEGLPAEMPHQDAVNLLNATAAVERVKVLSAAVQKGKIPMIWVTDGGNVAVNGTLPTAVNGVKQ